MIIRLDKLVWFGKNPKRAVNIVFSLMLLCIFSFSVSGSWADPYAWFTFDDNHTSGNWSYDSLLNISVNVSNVQKSVESIDGQAISCNGADQYGAISYNETLLPYYWSPRDRSWAVTFKVEQGSYGNVLFSSLYNSGNVGIAMYHFNSNTLRTDVFYAPPNNYNDASATVNATDGGWHIALGIYRSGTIELWYDGVNIANDTSGETLGTNFGLRDIYLCSKPTFSNYFNGSIDNIMFWNISLSLENASYYSDPSLFYAEETPPQPPSLTVYSPANQTLSNIIPEPSFKVVDNDNATVSCSLYVDDVWNQTNSAVSNDTVTNFTLTSFPTGSHTWEIKCDDNENPVEESGEYSYYYDPNQPVIQSGSPNVFNTTQFTGYTMTISGNATNLNLSNVTISIYYPNSSLFDRKTNVSFSDPTQFSWSWTYNTTTEPNGNWTMEIYAEDLIPNTNQKSIMFEVANCVPSWVCSGYAECNTSDEAPCNESTDSNACGLPYTGDLSEFSAQPCNYCSYLIEFVNVTDCYHHSQSFLYHDLNFQTCCNITLISSDCFFDEEYGYINQECSLFYTEDDVAPAMIDLIVLWIIRIGELAILFVITALMIWVIKSYGKFWKKW